MSASHFLSLTDLSTVEPVAWEGGPVALQYQRLVERFGASAPELLAFFAEPLSGANPEAARQVGWYVRQEGKPVPLPELPPNERAAAAEALSQIFHTLLPHLQDQDFGPFLGRCLVVPGPHDVVFVGDHPVLRNWGFIGKSADGSEAGLATSFADLLGRYARYPKAPWRLSETSPIRSPKFPPPVSPPPPLAVAPAAAKPFPPPLPRKPAPPWIKLVVNVLLMLTLVGGFGYLCWHIEKSDHPDLSAEEQQELAALQREIPTLEDRVKSFAAAADSDLCRPAAAITLPAAAAGVSSVIDHAVVLVIVNDPAHPKTPTAGTGVLIAPDMLVASRALVETAAPNAIFVAGRWLGGAYVGKVVERSGDSKKVDPTDVAVIKLETAPPGARPVTIATKLDPLSSAHTGAFLDFAALSQLDLQIVMDGTLSDMPSPAIIQAEVENDGADHSSGIPTVSAENALMPPGTPFAASFDGCNRLNGVMVRAEGSHDGPILLTGSWLIDLFKQGDHIAYTSTDTTCLAPPVLPPPPGAEGAGGRS